LNLVVAAVLVVAAFTPSTSAGLSNLARQSRGTATEQVVPAALVALRSRWGATAACVGYDVATNDPFSFFNDRLYDPGQRFAPFDSRAPGARGRPCSAEVVSGRPDLAASLPGAREVVPGNSVDQALWVLPGPLQDRLAAAGWLFPAGGPGPLPPAARRSRVALAPGQAAAVTIGPGSSAPVRLSVTHVAGGEGDSPWPNVAGLGRDRLAVQVVATWTRTTPGTASGTPPGEPLATLVAGDLPRTVLPGQTVSVTALLRAAGPPGGPGTGGGSGRPPRLAPGTYRVTLGLLQQGVGRLSSGPQPSATVSVTVTG
ncbi:MAG: hypothetical protein ACRDZQ_12310, partial [Acidimicrobiales bacterium]